MLCLFGVFDWMSVMFPMVKSLLGKIFDVFWLPEANPSFKLGFVCRVDRGKRHLEEEERIKHDRSQAKAIFSWWLGGSDSGVHIPHSTESRLELQGRFVSSCCC